MIFLVFLVEALYVLCLNWDFGKQRNWSFGSPKPPGSPRQSHCPCWKGWWLERSYKTKKILGMKQKSNLTRLRYCWSISLAYESWGSSSWLGRLSDCHFLSIPKHYVTMVVVVSKILYVDPHHPIRRNYFSFFSASFNHHPWRHGQKAGDLMSWTALALGIELRFRIDASSWFPRFSKLCFTWWRCQRSATGRVSLQCCDATRWWFWDKR